MRYKHGRSETCAGWLALRDAVYTMTVSDYRKKRHKGLNPVCERKFLISGSYQMDPELGKRILEMLERE